MDRVGILALAAILGAAPSGRASSVDWRVATGFGSPFLVTMISDEGNPLSLNLTVKNTTVGEPISQVQIGLYFFSEDGKAAGFRSFGQVLELLPGSMATFTKELSAGGSGKEKFLAPHGTVLVVPVGATVGDRLWELDPSSLARLRPRDPAAPIEGHFRAVSAPGGGGTKAQCAGCELCFNSALFACGHRLSSSGQCLAVSCISSYHCVCQEGGYDCSFECGDNCC